MKGNITKTALLFILGYLNCASALHADELNASIRNLIEVTNQLAKDAQHSCDSGDQKACDEVLVAKARVSILQLELRHPRGKIEEAASDVDSAMADLEDAVNDE
ncbi:MAG TPA: hypothetical protein VGF89_08935 [Steroidobacteraceae bacterium]